jgi:hypothetical protein
MQDYVTVLETMERPVYHVESGKVFMSLMAATIYQLPQRTPQLVLTRSTYMPNVTDATVFYTVISGNTLEDWKRNLEEMDLMIWNPVPPRTTGQTTSWPL